MNRLDIYYQDHLERAQKSRLVTELERMPSEYIDRFYVTVHTKEPYLADMVRLVPNNQFIWGGSTSTTSDPMACGPRRCRTCVLLVVEEQEKILEANPQKI